VTIITFSASGAQVLTYREAEVCPTSMLSILLSSIIGAHILIYDDVLPYLLPSSEVVDSLALLYIYLQKYNRGYEQSRHNSFRQNMHKIAAAKLIRQQNLVRSSQSSQDPPPWAPELSLSYPSRFEASLQRAS
jgi:hypothetical protein